MAPRSAAALLSVLLAASPALAQTRVVVPVMPVAGALGVAGSAAQASASLALSPSPIPAAPSVRPAPAGAHGAGLLRARAVVDAAARSLAAPLALGRSPIAAAAWQRAFDGGTGSSDGSGPVAPRKDIVEIREIPANGGQVAPTAVYRQDRWQALRKAGTLDSDFTDVYAVRTRVDLARQPLAGAELLAGVPGEFAIVRLPESRLPAFLERLHGFGPHHGALVRIDGERILPAGAAPAPVIAIDQTVALAQAAASRVDPAKIQETVEELAAIHTRWYKSATGKGVAEALAKRYRALAGSRADVEVIVDDHAGKLPQPSLIVRIKGRTRPDEIVVIGSHIDSTARDRAPGADDDASGTATNLETFRTLMEQGATFERTLEIHGYAAEEAGLLGSNELARRYAKAGKKVVAMLQNDMNLYKPKGAPDKIWFVTDDTTPELNKMLAQLAARYAGVPTGQGRLWGGTSDHLSWNRTGVPTSFPFEDPSDNNPNIHSERDTTEGMHFGQAAAFTKLGIAFAVHFAGASPLKRW
ncbi:MAG: M20/M25/M40 family metallo-hydrolase [Elusimicrobia bacterium]|nr:M20/M25/M40 family metallo-hydrolase [Elusimicrobiota bacterium]